MLESGKSLFEAKEIFHDLADYKKSKENYAKASNLLKKRNRKATLVSMIVIITIAIIAFIGTTAYNSLPSTKVNKFISICNECSSESRSIGSIRDKLIKAKLISPKYELTGFNNRFWDEFLSRKDDTEILNYLNCLDGVFTASSHNSKTFKDIIESFLNMWVSNDAYYIGKRHWLL
jgi:hypothetical protein